MLKLSPNLAPLLSIKVLARIVHNCVSKYLYKNNLLSSCQFGFRPCSSTQEALLSVTNKWQNLFTKHKQVATVFLDIRKAFDSAPHSQIISSLSQVGISGPLLDWFKDYLTGRSQRVVLDGCTSDQVAVTSCVPQGSILGPLMINIFMNSITVVPLSQNAELDADDILIYKPIDSLTDVNQFQQDMDRIVNWIKSQGLRPNHAKTQLLPITRCRRPLDLNLCVAGHQIKEVKYLGVKISSNPTWSEHIRSVCKTRGN